MADDKHFSDVDGQRFLYGILLVLVLVGLIVATNTCSHYLAENGQLRARITAQVEKEK